VTTACAGSLLPAVLALNAAFLFAVGIQFTRLGLRHTDSRTAALIQIGAAAGIYWVAAPFFVEAWFWAQPAIALLAAIGLFRPFISANLALAGTRHLGPTVSSTLSATAPLFSLALGVLVLGEAMTVQVTAGTLAVVAGVAVLSSRGRIDRDWPLWALALPVAAAFLRVLAQMLAKIGMDSIPSPFFVGLVGYSVSFALALGTHLRRRDPGPVRSSGLKWLMLAGILYGLAILSLNSALECGDLIVVSPIASCQPFFSLLLGRFLFKEAEIDTRVMLAVALVVPGVVLVTL
jgi:drug/metabolite transporter (DMT)-like permease